MRKLAVVLWLLVGLMTGARAAGVEAIIRDTQRFVSRPDSFMMVWWVPTEFWAESLKANRAVSEEQTKRMVDMFDKYTVIIAAAADIGPFAGVKARDPGELRKNLVLQVGERTVEMIAPEDLPADMRNLVGMFKPLLGNMLGQFGSSMEVLVYPNDPDGKSRIDAKNPGRISVSFYKEKFSWRLPIGSLLPAKRDPESEDTFPGDFIYNPYTGKKLVTP